jgi:RNA polymerase sigma-70 factor (ECF subfamily)
MDYASLSAEELVVACKATDDAGVWEEFVRRFHRLIATVVLRVARRWNVSSPSILDDLIQETYLKLCADNFRILRNFQSTHPNAFYGYLKVVTANLVHDHLKAANSSKRGSGIVEVEADSSIESRSDSRGTSSAVSTAERAVLLREVNDALSRVAAGPNLQRDRKVFLLYYRVGLSANAIAALPSIGLSTKGVESSILRLTRLLRNEIGKDRLKTGTSVRAE